MYFKVGKRMKEDNTVGRETLMGESLAKLANQMIRQTKTIQISAYN